MLFLNQFRAFLIAGLQRKSRSTLLLNRVAVAFLLLVAATVAWAQSSYVFSGTTAVGSSSTAQSITVSILQAGTLSSISVVTQGNPNQDFINAGGGSCTVGSSYTAGQSCTVEVEFSPKYPGIRNGGIVLQNSSGAVLGALALGGTGTGAVGVMVPGIMYTIAGIRGQAKETGDGALATLAEMNNPAGVAVDGPGNIYIADYGGNRVRMISASTGYISTLAGNGGETYTGDGGPATQASLCNPTGVAVDGFGNIYIADMGNSAIRKVTVATGIITTVAGTGVLGYTGDHGLATAAELSNPEGIALDTAGNLYIADTLNNVIRVVNEQSTTITIAGVSIPAGDIATIVGTGVKTSSIGSLGDGGQATAATLNIPYGVTVDASGNIYIADYGNSRIRKVATTGVIATVAGSANSGYSGDTNLATSAELSSPRDVAVDVAGNIYISDTANNVIRKVNAYTGIIETIAGSSSPTTLDGGYTATTVGLNVPFGIFLDGAGNLYLADESNNLLREVKSNLVTFVLPSTLRVGQKSATQLQEVENDGNAAMVFSAITADANAAIDLTATTCSTYTPLTSDSTCEVGAQFDASVVSNPAGTLITGNVTLASNAGNSPLDIQVIDSSQAKYVTTTTLTSSVNPSTVGQSVTFTSTVTSASGTPTGSVSFEDGSTVLATVTLNSSATATYATTALAAGSHSITAVYSGDSVNATSTSSVLTQVVQQTTTTTISPSTNPSEGRTAVTFTAVVTAPTGVATGNVVFSDNGTAIGAGALSTSGIATFTTAALTVGTHSITAAYGGDTIHLTSTSSVLSQVVNADPTTTQLTTSLTPTVYGTSVTFTVSVANSSLGAISGSVEFFDGATLLGTETLNSSAVAAFSTSTLAAGTHSITAVYEGDTWDATSTSSIVLQVVQLVPTSIGVTSSQNPLIAGNSVTFTATITGATGVAITGSVTFKNGSTTLGTGTVNASGVATYTTTTLTPGTYQITAVYAGDTNNAGSSSTPALPETVNQATTTTGLTPSVNPVVIGNTVVLTATVTGTGATPGGTVSFYDGGALLGTVTLASGVATYSATALALGSHTITAAYSGDTDDAASSTLTALIEVVNQATTNTTVTSSLNPSPGGITVTFTAAVTTNGSGLTGTVTFYDGATTLSTVTISGGSASYADTALTVGTHSIKAVYNGNTNNSTSTGTLSQVVQLATTSTAMTASPNPDTYGATVTLTAAVTGNGATPTGTVTFKDGATTLGSGTLNGVGLATFTTSALAVGSHTLAAVYGGDALDNSSTSNTVTLPVLPTTSSVLTSNPNPSIAGTAVTFSVTITGSGTTPTGTVTFKDGTNTIGTGALSGGVATFTTSALTVGSHSITTVYPGDASNAGNTSAVLTQTVKIATTQTALSAPSTSIAGKSIPLTATVTGNGATPTGTVTFSDGATTLGTGSLNASGVATFSLSTLTIGSHTLTAVYGGDTNDATSTSSPSSLTISQATTTTTVAANNNPATAGLPVIFTATVTGNGGTPSGTVSFYDGTTVLSTATLTSGTVSYTAPALSAGTHSITVVYSGDTNDAASTSAILTETMKQGATSASLTSSGSPSDVGSTVVFTAAVTGSGATMSGTVTFEDNGAAIGTGSLNSNGMASFSTASLAVGTHPITAVYGGDTNNAGSSSSVLSQVVQQQSSVKLLSNNNPSIAGTSVTFTVNVLGANGSTASGSVTIMDGGSTLTTVTLSGGTASYTTAALLPGTHSMTAVYSGDTNNLPSTSSVMSQVVQSASSSVTLVASPTTANYGTTITLTATVKGNGSTPTGTVTFTDGSVSLGTATLNASGVAALSTSTLSVGQHSIVAAYGGDANNGTSTSAAALVRIQQQTSVAITSSLNPSGAGSAVEFTATVSSTGSLMPTGTVNFLDGTTTIGSGTLNTNGVATLTLSTLTVGSHSIVASYGGDTLDSGSASTALSQVVGKNVTTTTLASSTSTVASGSSFTLVAIVASKGVLMPTGTVTFLSGSTVLGTGALNSSGVATLVVTFPIGNYSLTSSYAGDSNSSGSTSNSVSVSVVLGTDYSMSLNPTSLTMQSGQNATVAVSIQTALNYTDTVMMGCAGLPFAASCTFSQNQVALSANSVTTVQVVVDTASPLTSGGSSSNKVAASKLFYCALPGVLLLGWLFGRRRRARYAAWRSLALLLMMVGAALAMPGCGSTNYKSTPAGTYTIAVTAVGQSGTTHSATLTLTVK